MMSSAQIPVMIGSDKATQTIIAPVQHDLIAAQRYEVGDLFIFNNGLYKVTTAIAQGGTITIGTNCQAAPTLSDELIQRVNDIKKYSFGTPVELEHNTLYTADSDGYVRAYHGSSASGRVGITVNNVELTAVTQENTALVYVKKGMTYKIVGVNDSGIIRKFIPIV